MSKVFVLTIFLIMFLSCGNSNSASTKINYTLPKPAAIENNLSESQKIIADKLDTMFTRLNKTGAFN